jgi:hypothetical protein
MADKRRGQGALKKGCYNQYRRSPEKSCHRVFHGEFNMQESSRHFVRTVSAIALLVSLGADIAGAQAIIVERPMPAPRVEVIPAPPSPAHHWVPGHWAWRGLAWAWIPGHFVRAAVPAMPVEVVEVQSARPSPAHVWVKGHYVFEGVRWVWRPGVWIRL